MSFIHNSDKGHFGGEILRGLEIKKESSAE